jgi:hypothetical protein
MVNKLGQMKIQQMAFMLMAITLFFVLVGIFVLVFMFSNLKQSAELLEEENAMLLVTKLANSPEFSCGEAFGSSKANCVDADKAMALKENIGKYYDFWGVSSIEIRKNCNLIQIISEDFTGTGFSNFVSLCRKDKLDGEIYDKCELAKIIVGSK